MIESPMLVRIRYAFGFMISNSNGLDETVKSIIYLVNK